MHCSKNTGVMFLSEVALGKEYTITKDNCSLNKAPAGYDCVVARGNVEPGTVPPQFYSHSNIFALAFKFKMHDFYPEQGYEVISVYCVQ